MENNKDTNIPSLEELKSILREEAPFIAKKPYSMHIVNFSLILMEDKYGQEQVEKIIKELGLDKKGWEAFLKESKKEDVSKEEREEFYAQSIKDFQEMNK